MEAKVTPLDELCKSALEHYDRISTKAMEWNSLIPDAIESLKTLKAVKTILDKVTGTKVTIFTRQNESVVKYDKWIQYYYAVCEALTLLEAEG